MKNDLAQFPQSAPPLRLPPPLAYTGCVAMSDVKTVPEGWEFVPFESVTHDIRNGFVGTATDEYREEFDDDAIPYVVGSCVRDNYFDLKNLRYVSESFHIMHPNSQLVEGDILTVQSGHLGATAVVDIRLSNANCHAVIISKPKKEHLYSNFIAYYFNSPYGRGRLSGIFVGSSIPHINTKDLKKFLIPLPPLPEQHKIAAILSAWDDALSILARLIDAKRQQKQALAEQLLTGKRRLKGFEGEWKEKTVADVASEFSKKGQNKSLTVLSCTKHNGLVRSLEYFGKQIFSQDISGYKLVKRNMLAYATNHIDEGSIGLQNIEDEAVISPMYTVIETGSSITPEFLFALLKTETYLQLFIARMSASVDRRGSLRWKDFSKIPLRLPPLPEQQAIASVLSTLDAELSALTRQQAAVQQQKRGLMDLLLTGRVRVKVDGLQPMP